MGLFGESKAEKIARWEALDRENEVRRKKAKKKGMPYFGIRYEDDTRSKKKENKWWI
ncbi:hypothetical protein [Peribacillus asahii]|uniref:hypothetical protein n=1 Tax=Peribacillus asahii TaxID=228899 RepID=UPI0038300181